LDSPNNKAPIVIATGGQTREYDRLFVTSPPDETLKFLDSTTEERELFGRVNYFNYRAVLFRADGLKPTEALALPHNMTPERKGHLVVCVNNNPQSRIFTGYQYNHAGLGQDKLDEILRSDVQGLGGQVVDVLLRKAWKYFPHVKLGELDEDYYLRLNALQGQRGTYFLGPLFAFETTEHCAQFADWLVRQHDRPS
jgi:hypothetical protein